MGTRVCIDTTILGGLPVEVEGVVLPSDPSVGIFVRSAEDLCVSWCSGHPIPEHMLKRMTRHDWDRLIEELIREFEYGPDPDLSREDQQDKELRA